MIVVPVLLLVSALGLADSADKTPASMTFDEVLSKCGSLEECKTQCTDWAGQQLSTLVLGDHVCVSPESSKKEKKKEGNKPAALSKLRCQCTFEVMKLQLLLKNESCSTNSECDQPCEKWRANQPEFSAAFGNAGSICEEQGAAARKETKSRCLCSFRDIEPPILTCPADITVEGGGAAVELKTLESTATATDNLDNDPSITYEPASGTTFPVGQTAVTVSATDNAGNGAECSFTVSVTNPKASVGGVIFEDLNGDGIWDAGEQGIGGMIVDLLNLSGFTGELTPDIIDIFVVNAVVANPDGRYGFPDNSPGDYKIRVHAPPGFSFTIKNVGDDADRDSDVDRTTGVTDTFTLHPGDDLQGINAGMNQDNEPPVITCPCKVIFQVDRGNDAMPVAFSGNNAATATDTKDANPTITYSPNLPPGFPDNTEVEVTATASDSAGNVAQCTFWATVLTKVMINEIRIDQSGSDYDEYFELVGPPGTPLDGYTYIVIGDGSSSLGDGVIETMIDLSGKTIPNSGYYTGCTTNTGFQKLIELGENCDDALGSHNLFENSDCVTHMLVEGFSGAKSDDVDTDDDGVIDATFWQNIVDSVAVREPDCQEKFYSDVVVGPNGEYAPVHIYRGDSGNFAIGNFGDFNLDTPGMRNCPSDTDE